MEDQDILILDEPMNSLDEVSVQKVKELLKKIRKEKTIVLASHNKEDVYEMCDEVYVIESPSKILQLI
jgi:ABC-2 type transport system ATP-binding protein